MNKEYRITNDSSTIFFLILWNEDRYHNMFKHFFVKENFSNRLGFFENLQYGWLIFITDGISQLRYVLFGF